MSPAAWERVHTSNSLSVRSPVRWLALGLAAVVIALIVIFTVRLSTPDAPTGPITSIEYSQTKAIPHFDISVHTVVEPAKITAFTDLLNKYSINANAYKQSLNDGCTGGLATEVTLKYANSPSATFRIYDCASPVPKGTFVTDATALFTGWSAGN